jgi:outer membrane protein assembly factor BamB
MILQTEAGQSRHGNSSEDEPMTTDSSSMGHALLSRRDWLRLTALGASALAFPDFVQAASGDATPAWPQENGPFGNFNPRQYRVKLVDDLKDAKQLWVSEQNELGRAKGSSSGYTDMLADPTTHAGSSSGLIVADAKVFASSFRPRGGVWAEKQVRIVNDLGRFTGDRLEALKRNTAIDADDLTVAIDLKTGKTVWKAVEASKGLNRAAGKRLQFHGTPVYLNGRVFSLGTTGRVYCYDAATGKKQ